MPQLSGPVRFALGGLLAIPLLSACADRRENAAADSMLMRDLTLATSGPSATSGTTTLGDTAAGPAGSVPAATEPRNDMKPTPVRRPDRVVSAPSSAQKPTTISSSPTPPPANPVVTVPAPAPAPVAPAPATAAGPGAGRRSLGTGTVLTGRTDAQICSLANKPGDRFVVALASEVTGADGARIPAGTPILVEMAQPEEGSDFAFRAKAVQVDGSLVPIEGTVRAEGNVTDRRVSKGGDKGKVVTGAVVGAILGRVLGGGTKGTVIGAAGGAAAGTVAAARNSVTEHCLPAGATLTVTLSAPLVLTQGVP